MQLVQIGAEIRQKTILEIVQEMSDRQWAEIERLKRVAQDRAANKRLRPATSRCSSRDRVN
jgi:hypothetical protein